MRAERSEDTVDSVSARRVACGRLPGEHRQFQRVRSCTPPRWGVAGARVLGECSPSAVRSEELFEAWRSPGNLSKNIVRQTQRSSLGIHTYGIAGSLRLPEGFLVRLCISTLWTIGRGHASCRHLQILGGRWVRAQQIRRATSGVFDRLWVHIAHAPPTASESQTMWCSTFSALAAGVPFTLRNCALRRMKPPHARMPQCAGQVFASQETWAPLDLPRSG